MAVKVSLENVIEGTDSFEIDFHFLKISGIAELNARLVFLSIMELERYYRNPYTEILECLNDSDKEKVRELSNNDAVAFIHSKIIKENFPPIESMTNAFMNALAENKTIYINKLFTQMILQARQNNSLNVEFVADGEDDGLSIEKKQSLINDMINTNNLSNMADMIFNYYKKDLKKIYLHFTNSVYDFLAELK